MLEPLMFEQRNAIENFTCEFNALLKGFDGERNGKRSFQVGEKRHIEFLDTKREQFRQSGLLLRHRYTEDNKDSKHELTLKCRAADPFVPLSTDIHVVKGGRAKLEEDICPPFIARLSRSATITTRKRPPERFSECVDFFPSLVEQLDLPRNEQLKRVNGMLVNEHVYVGPKYKLLGKQAEFALIFWYRHAKGRIALVEFSYRYAVDKTGVDRATALAYSRLFQEFQGMDWVSSNSTTKTSYLYGSNSNRDSRHEA